MTKREAIDRGVKLAQSKGRERQWRKGDVVAHPSNELAMEFIEARGTTAIIGLNNQTWQYPLAEIFNPNDAKSFAILLYTNPLK